MQEMRRRLLHEVSIRTVGVPREHEGGPLNPGVKLVPLALGADTGIVLCRHLAAAELFTKDARGLTCHVYK